MPRVVILGAGGYGRLVLDILHQDRAVVVEGFVDPDVRLHGRTVNGVPVLGGDDLLPDLLRDGVEGAVAAIGDNHIRAMLFRKLCDMGFAPVNAIHPRAIIGSHVELGRGVVVMARAVVNVNARLGDDVVVNTGATIDHDDVLEDHAQVWPGANLAGNVTVGAFSYVGTGAVVVPGVKIGRNSLVGAGAVVIGDLPDDVVAVGVPARVIKRRA